MSRKLRCGLLTCSILKSHDLVILKVYPSDEVSLYQNEIKAYTSLNNATDNENILRCFGSYHTRSTDGSVRDCTIILENADKGTLLDLYKNNSPPTTFAETEAFWRELCQVVLGLVVIHHTPAGILTGTSIVHQDLKPSNIFSFSRQTDNKDDFNVLLKIGDFGMSHVRRSGSRGHGSLGFDNRSTRTYGPPELHWGDDVDYRVGPLVDVWSIGCVLLEAAVWVAFGERGRLEFQKRRRDENSEENPRQTLLGRTDSFHDGINRLNAVVEVLALIERDGRRSDDLTSAIVSIILNHVLVPKKTRYNARLLSAELDKIILKSRQISLLRRSRSTTSSAEHSHTSSHTQPSRNSEFVESPLSSSYTPLLPLLEHHTQTSSGDRCPTIPVLTTSQSRNNDYDMGPNAEANNVSTPDLDNTTTGRPWRQQSLLGIPDRGGIIHLPARGSRQSLNAEIEEDLWFNSRHPTPGKGYQSGVQLNQEGPWSPPARAQKNNTETSESTITPHRLPEQSLEYTRSIFPQLNLEDVDQRRRLARDHKHRPLLRGEEQAMPYLQKRDHVSLAFLL